MRKIKTKNKEQKYYEEESTSYSAKGIIIMIVVMAIVFTAFYFITVKVVDNKKTEVEPEEAAVSEEYQSEKILFGQMLTRKENEYYVYAYDEKSKFYSLYEQYIKDYTSKEKALPIYRVDMNDGMNKEYIGNKTIVNDSLEGLQVSDITLFKIKDGKIIKHFIASDDIASELKD